MNTLKDFDFEARAHLQAADGYLALRMYQDAWDSIQKLEPRQRAHPIPMRMRLKAAAGLRLWKKGMRIVEWFQGKETPKDREAIGRFRLAYARRLLSRGKRVEALAQIRLLAEIWPEGKRKVLNDPWLCALLASER